MKKIIIDALKQILLNFAACTIFIGGLLAYVGFIEPAINKKKKH